MYQVGNIYVIAATAVIGGGLFGRLALDRGLEFLGANDGA